MKMLRTLLIALLATSFSLALANDDAPEVTLATYSQGLVTVEWKHTTDIDDVSGYLVHGYGSTGSGNTVLFELAAGPVSSFLRESDEDTHFCRTIVRGSNYIPEKVFVSCTYSNGDTLAGGLFVVTNPNSDRTLEFHVQSSTIESGVNYTYTPQLPLKKDIDVEFVLEAGPTGMTIDAETGQVKWTPTEAQEGATYAVIVTVAYVDGSGSYTTEWLLTVRGCVRPINVYVVDENEDKVLSGVVTIWKKPTASGHDTQIVATENITNGYYGTHVEEGVYYVQYSDGRLYEDVWYEDAPSIHNATPVRVSCETDSINITMQTSSKQQEEMMVFEGQVLIEENAAQGLLVVEYIGLDPELPESKRWDAARYFTTMVGMTPMGVSSYRIEVPAGLHYYALVRSSQNGGLSIVTEYYDNVTDIEDAEIIESNNIAINFTPEIRVPGRVGFKGYVEGLGEGPIASKVVATRIMQRGGGVFFERYITTTTGDSAMFIFENLPAGDYVAQAIPLDREFVPGYYSEEDNFTAVQHWQDATIITVSDICLPQLHPILLEERTVASDEEDRIVSGGIGATPGSVKNNGGVISVETPVHDAVVVVRGMDLVVYTLSDTEGLYSIGNLLPGTYEMIVDKPNFDRYVTTFTIEEEESGVQKDVELVGSITDVESEKSQLSALYNNGFELTAIGEHTIISIKVMSMRGETVAESHGEPTVDIRSLSSGAYVVLVEVNNTTETHVMTIVR